MPRTVVITGAGRGIGRATALTFARTEANLLLCDISDQLEGCPYPLATADDLEETATRCRQQGSRVITAAVDVRHADDVQNAANRCAAEFGPVDVLVNNAGVVGPAAVPAHELTEQQWSLVVDIDLSGAWRCSKAFLPPMIERRSGSIVNVSSTAGLVAFPMFANYVAAKHGLIGLTRALALDCAPYSVRVNAVCPTSVRDDPNADTGMLHGVAAMLGLELEDYEALTLPHHPLGSLIEADDVAATIFWLCSDEASAITGVALPVDAGFTSR